MLPNILRFIHSHLVRQKKRNIHNKTNKYRCHFRSNPHQSTSLIRIKFILMIEQAILIHKGK